VEHSSGILKGELATHRIYQFVKVCLLYKLAATRQIKPVTEPFYTTVQGTILPSLEEISYLGLGLVVDRAVRPDLWHSCIYHIIDTFCAQGGEKEPPSISL
jgi:hypothetical protein